MKTYEIKIEETVLVTYWVDADTEEQAVTLWKNGDIMEWNRHETEANDELISITLDSETTDEIILVNEYDLKTPNKQCENCDTGNTATHTVITLNGETQICGACHND